MKDKILTLPSLLLLAFLVAGCYVNEFDEENELPSGGQTFNAVELQQHISMFNEQVGAMVQNCKTAMDMESRINEVKQMEGVDDAWVDNGSFCIIDKQGITHMWDFNEQDVLDVEDDLIRLKNQQSSRSTRSKTRSGNKKSACLIMSNGNLYNPVWKDYITDIFDRNDFDVTFVSGSTFTPDYFAKYEYQSEDARNSGLRPFADHDVYFVICHGGYNKRTGLHWVLTDMPASELNQQAFAKYPWTRFKNYGVYYQKGNDTQCVMISDKFFQSFSSSFTRKPILFFGSCRLMEGSQDMAKVFVDDLNAGVFMGYITAIAFSRYAGSKFYELMLDCNYTFHAAVASLNQYQVTYKKKNHDNSLEIRNDCFKDFLLWYPLDFNSTPNPHEGIDMGTSVKWAKWNIGTGNIYELGDSLRWSEISPWCQYHYSTLNGNYTYTKIPSRLYGTPESYDYKERNVGGDPDHDPVTANWGGTWRLPTKAEFEELLDETKFNVERIINTTPNYLRITSKADPSKILVFAYPDISWFSFSSYVCPYWTSDYYHCINEKGENEMEAWSLLFAGTFPVMSDCPGYYAGYARGVQPR